MKRNCEKIKYSEIFSTKRPFYCFLTCCVKIFQLSASLPSSLNHEPSFIIDVDPVLWSPKSLDYQSQNTETLESGLKLDPRTCARHVTVFRHSVSNFGDMNDKVFVSKLNFLLSRLKLMY